MCSAPYPSIFMKQPLFRSEQIELSEYYHSISQNDNLPTLEHRREVNRLTFLYKTLHGQAAINIPPYMKHITVMKTRNSDPMKFFPIQTSCDEYKCSFWPRTINDWSNLSSNIINVTSISNFKAAVNNFISA